MPNSSPPNDPPNAWSRTEHLAAQSLLRGSPFVAVPIEQLTDICRALSRLTWLGQTDVREPLPSKEVRELRHAVFAQAEMAECLAFQWLPKDVHLAVNEEMRLEREKAAAKPSRVLNQDESRIVEVIERRGESYGAEIYRDTGIGIIKASLILYRLHEEGRLSMRIEPGGPERGYREKRLYRLKTDPTTLQPETE